MVFRWRRWHLIVAVVAVLALASGVPAIRTAILRAVGWALVVDEPVVGPADVIVVPQWAGSEGVLAAADLVDGKIATRVVVLSEPSGPAEQEIVRRGIPFQDRAALMVQLLDRFGVPDVERIPMPAAGTDAAGRVLSAWCAERRVRTMVVVTLPDHSRRVRRVLRRSLDGQPTKVMIRSARYASFDPDRWWQTRDNIRTAVIELQKLLLDIARHPLS
jgi:hypothetical protein